MITGPLAPDGVRARSMPPTAERLAVTCERGGVDHRTYERISGPGRSRHAASLDRRASPSAQPSGRAGTHSERLPSHRTPSGVWANYPETLEATPRAAEARLAHVSPRRRGAGG